ncbi:tetratricopeptide repeat protein [Bartonella taylorii]|uniref:tetratricopeptide repeat protein n=1 Tax=Bartonella taylorii TaxID=33046 RepID=UPI001FEFDC62|nr:hypothetical protein [Bartonella taylorii]
MWMCLKQNWKTAFCMAVLVVCSVSFAQSAARKASQYSTYDSASEAAGKAADAVNKVGADAADKAADAVNKAGADAAGKAADAVNKAGADAAGKAADAADKAVDAVKKVGADAADKAVDAVNKAGADAAGKAVDAVNKAGADAAGKAVDAVNKAGAEAADKAVDAVNKVGADAADKAVDVVNKVGADAADKAADAVNKAGADAVDKASDVTGVAPSFQGMLQSREFILENQRTLFKDYDLDKLLHDIRTVLEHNDVKNVQKQFHQLFDKKDSSVYSCAFESASLGENLQTVKEGRVQEQSTKDDQSSVANVENHDHKSRLQEMDDRLQKTAEHFKEGHKDAKETEDRLKEVHKHLEKVREESVRDEPYQGQDFSLLAPKALYKKGYNFIASANYVDAEKAFCAFQHHYKKDPLSDDALFWLAEALLGQKRYHEAAQVYLNAWYTDKKMLYTSEILLKLAMSMVSLDQNKETCALFAKRPKRHKTLASVFCKPLKRGGVVRSGR